MTSSGLEAVIVNGIDTSASSCSLPLDLKFATDLLFNLDDVRAACASGLVAHGNLVTMLKSRIQLERTFAHELSKISRFASFEERERGTMQHAMASLRAQYLNTSVQHRQLATNLEEEVLKPIETLYEQNSQRAQNLTRRLNHAKKDVKVQEDAYRKDYSTFDKHFCEAAASFSAAMDSGYSSTLLETQYHHCLSQLHVGSPSKTNLTSTLAARTQRSFGAGTLRSINNRKLVSWLLPSLDTHRKEEVANTTVKLMAAAENARQKCQQTWQGVETSRIRFCRAVQVVLADYQQLAEDRIVTLATNLRKHVVYASSALANEQYDWQTVAPKLEHVDVKSDIYDFIRLTRGKKEHVHIARLTVNDLCNDTAQSLVTSLKLCRPLRKSCLEIRDLSAKKVPFDYDGNQELLGDALSASSSASCESATHLSQNVKHEFSCLQIGKSVARHASSADVKMAALLCATDEYKVEEIRGIQIEPELDCDDVTPSVSPSGSGDSSLDHENELEATVGTEDYM